MLKESFQSFGLKFVDIMFGIVLGLGFQWWPDLHEPWQYIAFIFIYLNLIDYWIDYSPTIKKFPPRKELDLIIHIFIMFMIFLLVYSTRGVVAFLFLTFVIYRIADLCWLFNISREYKCGTDKRFVDTWIRFDIVEVVFSVILFFVCQFFSFLPALAAVSVFIIFRLTTRVLSSVRYKKIFFA